MRRWLDWCSSLDCERPTTTYRPTEFDACSHFLCHVQAVDDDLPSRLIYVGDDDDDVRLYAAHDEEQGSRPSYATLTHCWGPSGIEAATTQQNYGRRLQAIEVESLPRTFQHAIIATRRLGLQYVWIDGLCILQDDAEDWLKECNRMGSIYANCTINLVAAAADGSSVGCFFNRGLGSERAVNLHLRLEESSEEKTLFCCIPSGRPEPSPKDSITVKRAWCFQETYLAPRNLYFFKSELAWECRTISASEDFSIGHGSSYDPLKFLRRGPCKASVTDWCHIQQWVVLVIEYSRAKLNFSKDKLVAMSGIAKAFHKHFSAKEPHTMNHHYLAGL